MCDGFVLFNPEEIVRYDHCVFNVHFYFRSQVPWSLLWLLWGVSGVGHSVWLMMTQKLWILYIKRRLDKRQAWNWLLPRCRTYCVDKYSYVIFIRYKKFIIYFRHLLLPVQNGWHNVSVILVTALTSQMCSKTTRTWWNSSSLLQLGHLLPSPSYGHWALPDGLVVATISYQTENKSSYNAKFSQHRLVIC